MRRSRLGLVIALLSAWLLAACGGASAPVAAPPAATPPASQATALAASQAAAGATITVGVTSDLTSGDPYLAYDLDSSSMFQHIFDTLIDTNPDGSFRPGLAASWRAVDEKTLEFKLQPGVKFTDGEDFNADAVKFSIERVKNPDTKSATAASFLSVDTVTVVDPLTVQLNLNRPDAAVLFYLTQLPMLPPQYIQQVGADGFAAKPVGTGPYTLAEWVHGDHVTLQANASYWEASGKGKPGPSTIIFKPIPDPSARIAALKSGQVQIIRSVPGDIAASVETADVGTVAIQSSALPMVLLDTKSDGPLKDVRVRQALNYAVDVETIMKDLLHSPGTRLATALPSTALGFDPALQPYPFDVAKAKELLSQAGFAAGFAINMDYAQGEPQAVVEAVQAYLGTIGVTATLQSFDHATFNANWVQHKESPLRFDTWGGAADPNGTTILFTCAGGLSRYCDPSVDSLWRTETATYDTAQRQSLVAQAEQQIHTDAPAIFLYPVTDVYGVSKKVTGFQPYKDGRLRVYSVSLE